MVSTRPPTNSDRIKLLRVLKAVHRKYSERVVVLKQAIACHTAIVDGTLVADGDTDADRVAFIPRRTNRRRFSAGDAAVERVPSAGRPIHVVSPAAHSDTTDDTTNDATSDERTSRRDDCTGSCRTEPNYRRRCRQTQSRTSPAQAAVRTGVRGGRRADRLSPDEESSSRPTPVRAWRSRLDRTYGR